MLPKQFVEHLKVWKIRQIIKKRYAERIAATLKLMDCNSRFGSEGRVLGVQGKAQSTAIAAYRAHLQRSHVRQVRDKHFRIDCYGPLATGKAVISQNYLYTNSIKKIKEFKHLGGDR